MPDQSKSTLAAPIPPRQVPGTSGRSAAPIWTSRRTVSEVGGQVPRSARLYVEIERGAGGGRGGAQRPVAWGLRPRLIGAAGGVRCG